jgi:Zn-dependent peptidase ImmA (M78 family)
VDLIGAPQRQGRSVSRTDDETTPYWQPLARVEFARPRPIVRLPLNIGWNRGRVAAAHEIGHVLIHRRGDAYDQATIRLGSTPVEEVLAEYAARLLLLPRELLDPWLVECRTENYALKSVKLAQLAQVSLHAATARLGDPDAGNWKIRGAILWRMSKSAEQFLTPYWHLCPGAYIPLARCKARKGSLIDELGNETSRAAGSRVEEVNVGSLRGKFLIDAFSWGSLADRTRVVLSVFQTESAEN